MDLIRLAYERTIHATSKPSVMYASKILERWHTEGLKTPEAVEASEHKTDEPQSGNFDTEDFFEAALRRSYGDTYGKPDADPKTGTPQ
jgi:DNA replication protein DnaD